MMAFYFSSSCLFIYLAVTLFVIPCVQIGITYDQDFGLVIPMCTLSSKIYLFN